MVTHQRSGSYRLFDFCKISNTRPPSAQRFGVKLLGGFSFARYAYLALIEALFLSK